MYIDKLIYSLKEHLLNFDVSDLYIVGSFADNKREIHDVDFLVVLSENFSVNYKNLLKFRRHLIDFSIKNNIDIKFKDCSHLKNFDNLYFHILIVFEDIIETIGYLRPLADKWLLNNISLFGVPLNEKVKLKNDCRKEWVLWNSHYGIANIFFDIIDKFMEREQISENYLIKRIFISTESYMCYVNNKIECIDEKRLKDYLSSFLNVQNLENLQFNEIFDATLYILRKFIYDILEK